MAKEFLNKKEIEFEWVNAEENPEFTKEVGVKQAPTLVVFKDGNIEKIPNLSNIKKFTEEYKKPAKKGRKKISE